VLRLALQDCEFINSVNNNELLEIKTLIYLYKLYGMVVTKALPLADILVPRLDTQTGGLSHCNRTQQSFQNMAEPHPDLLTY
jgi:hypothetical protein